MPKIRILVADTPQAPEINALHHGIDVLVCTQSADRSRWANALVLPPSAAGDASYCRSRGVAVIVARGANEAAQVLDLLPDPVVVVVLTSGSTEAIKARSKGRKICALVAERGAVYRLVAVNEVAERDVSLEVVVAAPAKPKPAKPKPEPKPRAKPEAGEA